MKNFVKCWGFVALLALAFTSAQAATVGTFTGGDVGEGLDLDGSFLYAVNIGGDGNGGTAPNRVVRDATFTDDFNVVLLTPGVEVSHSAIDNFGTQPNFGATTNDDNLEEVMWDIGHGTNQPQVQFANLAQNTTYKFQILLSHNGSTSDRHGSYLLYDGTRVDDPVAAGRTILDSAINVDITEIVGASNTLTTGVVITMVVNTGSFTTLSITSRDGTGGADNNAIMNAVTVETIPTPAALPAGLGLLAMGAIRRRRA